jgi:hypothetical protein
MNNSVHCNGSVGPLDLIENIGLSVLVPGYVMVITLVVSVFSYGLFHKLKCGRLLAPVETFQILYPALLILITILPLISPVLYQMVSILQDLLATLAMFIFMNQSVNLIGGYDNLIGENARCPLATPPLCCLIPCKRPKMTRTMMNLIFLPIKIIVVLNIVLLLVNMALTYNGIPPPKAPTDIANIPSFALAPFQISAMYAYKVFIRYVEPKLQGTFPRTRGRLIFVTFILCKSTGGIFSVLEGQEVLKPVEGLECINYSQLLLPLVQLGLLLPIALIIPKVYTKKWIKICQDDDTKICDINETNHTKLEDCNADDKTAEEEMQTMIKANEKLRKKLIHFMLIYNLMQRVE